MACCGSWWRSCGCWSRSVWPTLFPCVHYVCVYFQRHFNLMYSFMLDLLDRKCTPVIPSHLHPSTLHPSIPLYFTPPSLYTSPLYPSPSHLHMHVHTSSLPPHTCTPPHLQTNFSPGCCYYGLLVPLTLPVGVAFAYCNRVGLKFFVHN